MLMLSLVRALAALVPLAARLATWIVARALNMPEPLVHATGQFVVVQVQALESSAAKSLCPFRLARRLRSLRFRQTAGSSSHRPLPPPRKTGVV